MLQPYAYQVGGHSKPEGTPECLVDGQGRFLKKLQAGERGEREALFYQAVEQLRRAATAAQQQQQQDGAAVPVTPAMGLSSSGDAQVQTLQQLADWVPTSYGVVVVDGQHYLAMEDQTASYQRPCVLDIKVGYRTDYPWGSAMQQQKYRDKDAATTQGSLGFRLCGVLVQCGSGAVWRQDRHWGKALTPDTLGPALRRFADNGTTDLTQLCVGPGRLLEQLHALAAVFERQAGWHFFSTSLLIIYEGAARSGDELRVRVRLIDFAHTFPVGAAHQQQQQQQAAAGVCCARADLATTRTMGVEGPAGRDQNFLDGLSSFIRVLEGLLAP